MNSSPTFETFYEQVRQQPIYVILGVQGSGTNLLRSILSRAFNFSVVQDQSLVFNAARALGPAPTREAVDRQFAFLRSRLQPSALTRKTQRRIKTNSSFDGFDTHVDPARIHSGADLARIVYAYSAYMRRTPLMAIKSDDLWETISDIDLVLPHRRVILLTRDFRDNLLSICKKDFGPVDPLVAARYVKDRFAHYDAEYRRTPASERLHVTYEELLEAPDLFVQRCCEHFGLASDGRAPAPLDTTRIRRNNKRKWAALTPRQLALCEAVLRDELVTYGYTPEAPRTDLPGAPEWLIARGRDALGRVPQKLRRTWARLQK